MVTCCLLGGEEAFVPFDTARDPSVRKHCAECRRSSRPGGGSVVLGFEKPAGPLAASLGVTARGTHHF